MSVGFGPASLVAEVLRPRRLALVTGANGGIGQAIVARLVAAGTAVAALDRDPAVVSLAAIGTVATPVHPVVVDLADATAARRAADEVVALLGPVDVLINNAGVMHKKHLPDHTLEDWELEMAVNARAAFILCQALVPSMAARGAGIVINIASIWASRGGPERAAYVASKHALLGLTRALAAEYLSAGVRINAVSPGPVRTAMTAGLGGDQSSWLEADEVAGTVEFLCGDSARGISGENLEVLGRGRPAGL
jgi:3-oxoacyl-[acyl-carrier protein] reductase